MKPVAVVAICLAVLVVGILIGRLSMGFTPGGTFGTSFPAGGEVQNDAAAGGATVNTSQLSDSQRAMLRAFGIDTDSVTITPAMVACAEGRLGAARVEEIRNGAAPTMAEGAMLFACYQSN
jgi:hypothetical protein